jgi:hypothetical protein
MFRMRATVQFPSAFAASLSETAITVSCIDYPQRRSLVHGPRNSTGIYPIWNRCLTTGPQRSVNNLHTSINGSFFSIPHSWRFCWSNVAMIDCAPGRVRARAVLGCCSTFGKSDWGLCEVWGTDYVTRKNTVLWDTTPCIC